MRRVAAGRDAPPYLWARVGSGLRTDREAGIGQLNRDHGSHDPPRPIVARYLLATVGLVFRLIANHPFLMKTSRGDLLKKTSGVFGFTSLPSYLATGARAQGDPQPPSKRITLGCIAQYLNRDLKFDPETKQITNDKEANARLSIPPRKGWEEFYKMV